MPIDGWPLRPEHSSNDHGKETEPARDERQDAGARPSGAREEHAGQQGQPDYPTINAGSGRRIKIPGEEIREHHPPPTVGHPEREAAALEDHHVEDYRQRFWVTLILTIPVLFFSDVFQSLLGYNAPVFLGSQLVPLVFSSIVFFYGGSVFLKGSYQELTVRLPGMMTLIALAITVAYVFSLATQFIPTIGGMPLYWELDTLVVIMLLGHWMEMRAVSGARGALAELAKLLPDTAKLVVDGKVEEVGLDRLRVDDVVLVRPGARIPADGEVISGESTINEAMITGESRPVSKTTGDQVIAGAVNGEGSLRIRVTRTGKETALAGIMLLVEQAQRSRSRAQALADRAAYYLVLIAIGSGTLTAIVWLVLGAGGAFALNRAVTVLVIACPHALGLAIPLVVAISTTLGASYGLLVRDRLALEKARELSVIVFDKTGTLTVGEQRVTGVIATDSLNANDALALAAAVEGDSEHGIAGAIRDEARRLRLPRLSVTDFEAIPGRGARARVGGRLVMVGGPRLLETLVEQPGEKLRLAAERWGEEGKTVVYLVVDGQPCAAIALADTIRPASFETVRRLRQMGLRVVMLTGDSWDVAGTVARTLGIDEYFAEILPGNKADVVRDLREQGQTVGMVGDGVNDAPALVMADVGIAIGAGTDVAIASAGIILTKSDPGDVVRVIELSRASYEKMVQNLFWATGYNVVAIPLAAGLLAPWGIVLVPAVGALLMSVSTVIVAINAQLLRRLDLRDAPRSSVPR